MKLSLVCLSFLFTIALLHTPAHAVRGGCGREVVFDCDRNVVVFNGTESPLGCGAATRPKAGIIGQPGRGAGSVFPSMKNAPLVTMIPPPGPKPNSNIVIHKVPPHGNSCPNQHNRGAGCLRVCPSVLEKISRCYGTPYVVKYSRYGRTPRIRTVSEDRDFWSPARENAYYKSSSRRATLNQPTGFWARFFAFFGGGGGPAKTKSNPFESSR